MEAKLIHKVVSYGKNRYRFTESTSEWEVLLFGWWPDSRGRPSWRWEYTITDKVPEQVRRLCGRT